MQGGEGWEGCSMVSLEGFELVFLGSFGLLFFGLQFEGFSSVVGCHVFVFFFVCV